MRFLALVRMVCVATVGTAVLWTEADWSRVDYLLLLTAMAWFSQLVTIRVGGVRFSASDVAIVLAIVLMGAVPAVAVGVSSILFDGLIRRPPLRNLVNNVVTYAALPSMLGGAWVLADSAGLVTEGSGGFLIGVVLLTLAVDLLSFLLVASTSPDLIGQSVAHTFRVSYVPLLPWGVILAGLAAGAAHAVGDFGIEPMIGLATLIGVAQLTLLAVERAERREVELARAAIQRERMASHVHDDALQVLAAARQDLAEVQGGNLDRLELVAERLDLGMRQLRVLLSDHMAGEQGVGAFAELAGRLVPESSILQDVARELLQNAEQHAAATSVSLCITRLDGRIRLEVADDGCGFGALVEERRREEGHVGLALLRRRVALAGGTLDVRTAPGEGTVVVAEIPVAGVAA